MSQASHDSHREALIGEMHPALQQLFLSRAVLNRRFQIVDVLGAGGFATVLKCVDLAASSTGCKQVAAKVAIDAVTDETGQLSDQQIKEYKASMKHEHLVYKQLSGDNPTAEGIPIVYGTAYMRMAFDTENPHKLCFLSMLMLELLGKDAWHLSCIVKAYRDNRGLLVKHAISMLKTLQHIHQQGFIHRDVKPENFCLPSGCQLAEQASSADRLCIVDMGMAMKWNHAGFSWDKQDYVFFGTVDFASVRSLKGFHPTPRDDLESLACVLLEMAQGESAFSLLTDDEAGKPLQHERLLQLAEMKEHAWTNYLSKDCTPGFIKQWMRHVRTLPLQHVPSQADYDALESILRSAQSCNAAVSAWSSAVPFQLQQQPGVGRKRMLTPVLSNTSCMSDTATVMQPKKLRGEADEEGCGLVSGVLMSTPE